MTPRLPKLLLSLLCGLALQGGLAAMPEVKTETFDDSRFVFPTDLAGTRQNLLFLAMAENRENGEAQQNVLLDWHQAIADSLPADTLAYHFPVMESPPFFVKGLIRNAMRKSYKDKVPLSQVAVLFIDDLAAFAKSAGLQADGQATVVLLNADGSTALVLKGEVDEAKLTTLRKALSP